MKFSLCGRLLATAGQDNIVRVWVLRNHLAYFNSMRERYNAQCKQSSSIPFGDGVLRNTMQQIGKDFRSSSTTVRIMLIVEKKHFSLPVLKDHVNFKKYFLNVVV